MFEMLHAADPPLLYAVVGVIVLAVASLLGLVLFASREETFEDVVEKQRKAQEALLHSLQQGTTAKSGKQNRKWTKLKNKKSSKGKVQEEHEIDSGVDDDELSTECVTISAPPPTIAVEEPPPAPAPSKKKKKSKKNKNQQQETVEEKDIEEVKPVVEEEDVVIEEVSVEEEVIVESSAPDVESTPDVPSDDEVDNTADDDASEDESEEVPVVEDVVEEEEEEEEEIVEEPAPAPAPVVVQPVVVSAPRIEPVIVVVEDSKPKKKKNKSANKQQQQQQQQQQKGGVSGGVITNTVDKLQSEVKNCHMNADEVQQFMDVLLEKQSELEQWQKPNQKSDPIEQLKKRIAEAEMQFAEERQSAQAIAGKMKELKLELQQERNHRQSIQNEATNRLGQQAKEGEAIRKRMEEKHMSEMHSAQSQISRMQQIIDDSATNHMELQRTKEENTHLKNASMMAQQLAEDKQSLMTELSQLQQTNKALRQEFDNLIIHHQQEMQNIQIAKVDSEGALSQRLQEMNDQLMKIEAHNRSLQLDNTELQRLSEQHRMSEIESFQMTSKPDEEEVEELTKQLSEIQEQLNERELSVKLLKEQSETKNKELEGLAEKLLSAELKITEHSGEKEVEPVNGEVASLVARVEQRDQLILHLEQKVTELEHLRSSSGQHSPDLVVVTPGDLLGSEPLLTSESFEEVVADKDFEEEVEEVIVPLDVPVVESAPIEVNAPIEVEPEVIVVVEVAVEESLPDGFLEEPVDDTSEQLEALQCEIERLKAEYSTTEEKLGLAQRSLSEKDQAIAGHVADIAEKVHKINEHEAAVAKKQAEIDQLQSKILGNQTTTNSDKTVAEDKTNELNKIISEKDNLINELKQKVDETPAKGTPADGEPSYEELVENLNTIKEDLRGRVDATDELKMKNNELREKNWKVIDALAKAEQLNADNTKSTQVRIIKGLKSMHPGIKLPKFDNDIELLFKEFGEKVTESTKSKCEQLAGETKKLEGETNKLEEVNKCLVEEMNELKKTNELMNASQDEILKSQQENGQLQEENAHIKNVLIETESMLCRLQTGVDAEVQKWQKKVSEKDGELEASKKSNEELKQVLSKHGYEHEDLTVLESSLTDGQKQLMAEKEENSRIKTELKEVEKNLTDTQNILVKEKDEQAQKQLQENITTTKDSGEVAELNTKLKKTISERDLLIREYKNVKDNSTKMEAELNETKQSLLTKTEDSQALADQIEQLKANLTAGETPTSTDTVENGTVNKDELIKKLTEEIEELKQELREDRDCVIVDIDPDNSENLTKQVEDLSTELESEKQCKASLVSKLEDIEKSYDAGNDAGNDKFTNLESKLKLAEQKILELEGEKKLLQKSTQKDASESRCGTSV